MFINALGITGDSLANMDAANVRQLWGRIANMFEKEEDAFIDMEGGPEALIESITDLSVGKGQKITFPEDEDFYGEPRMGDQRFTSADHYDTLRMYHNELLADWLRFGSNYSARTEEAMGMRDEILDRIPEKQGKQWGKKKSEMTQMTILHKTNAENQVIAGRRNTVHDLHSSDTLSYDEIISLGAIMEPMGGSPAVVGQDPSGNMIYGRCIVATVPAAQSLESDPTYVTNQQKAAERGKGNKLFAGGLETVKGHVIMKHNPVDKNEAGPIGSPLFPKARLGVAITAGSSALTITGGGNATNAALPNRLYFKSFPKYAYAFLLADVLSTSANFWELGDGVGTNAASGNFFVVIVNSRAAAVDPGKWNMYEISANDGANLTCAKRMGVQTASIESTTVGALTYDSSVNTQTHAEGSLIFLANKWGLPLMCTPALSRGAVRRGYGKYRNFRATDTDEGGFGKYTYLWSVFGQNVRKDASGRVPAIALLKHTGPIEGWTIPTRA